MSSGKDLIAAARVFVMAACLACSTPNPNVRAHRLPDGRVEVEGPLAGPFQTTEELAEKSCAIMTNQPGASSGAYGSEYCALYYYSRSSDGYFLSYLSDIKNRLDSELKTCVVPSSLKDQEHRDAIILGKAHTHSNNRRLSFNDMSVAAHWYPTKAVDGETGRIWNRGVMLFYREKTGVCSAYPYDNVTRLVMALRGGQWVAIGKAYDEQGNVEMLEGMDWLP